MTEPVEPSTPDGTDEFDERPEPEVVRAEPKRPVVRRWVSGRRSRWVVGGLAAVVVLGGTVLATAAVAHHQGERVGVRAMGVGPDGVPALKRMMAGPQDGPDGPGQVALVKGGQVVTEGGQVATELLPVPGAAGAQLAPAPLPSLAADQAVDKAAAAVAGGKVESLETVPEQGGGSAWQATVLGPDGVRHLVTVDGTSGTVTSNTTVGG